MADRMSANHNALQAPPAVSSASSSTASTSSQRLHALRVRGPAEVVILDDNDDQGATAGALAASCKRALPSPHQQPHPPPQPRAATASATGAADPRKGQTTLGQFFQFAMTRADRPVLSSLQAFSVDDRFQPLPKPSSSAPPRYFGFTEGIRDALRARGIAHPPPSSTVPDAAATPAATPRLSNVAAATVAAASQPSPSLAQTVVPQPPSSKSAAVPVAKGAVTEQEARVASVQNSHTVFAEQPGPAALPLHQPQRHQHLERAVAATKKSQTSKPAARCIAGNTLFGCKRSVLVSAPHSSSSSSSTRKRLLDAFARFSARWIQPQQADFPSRHSA